MPVGKRLRDVMTANDVGPREVRDRACDAQNPRSTTTGKPQPVHGLLDQLHRIRSEVDRVALDLCIARRTGRTVTVTQGQSGAVDAFRDHRAGFTVRRMSEFRGGSGLDLHSEIDSVENGSADTIAVILTASRSATALPFSIAKIPAAARIHRRHELKACRVGNMR